jgi:hypothetical protein
MSGILQHVNAALTRTGNAPISSFADGTAPATVASENYDRIVETELSSYRWKFAEKSFTLNRLSAVPDLPWTYAYQLPADLLNLRAIYANGELFSSFDVRGTQALVYLTADTVDSTTLVATYTAQVPEANWPGYFAECVRVHLEAVFLRGIGERYAEADSRQAYLEKIVRPRARSMDSQSYRTGSPFISPILAARRA